MPGHRTDNEQLARYANAKRSGNLLFVAGVSGRGRDNKIPGVNHLSNGTVQLDPFEQTIACFANLEKLLAEHGLALDHLVDVTCYLVNMNDYGRFVDGFNEVFAEIEPPPRTTVSVHQLPDPLLNVEIKAIASFER